MSLAHKIARNTIWQVIGRSVGLGFSLISLGIITRYLGQEGFGNYTTIFAFLQLFSIMADFGLTLMSLQLISEIHEEDQTTQQEKTDKIFSNIFTLRLILASALLILAFIIIQFFPYPQIVKYGVLISGLTFLFSSLCQIIQSVFQKNLQMLMPTMAELISKSLFLISAYLVVMYDWKLYGFLIFFVITGFVHLVLMLFWAKKFVKITLATDLDIWKKILGRSWPIAISIIFNLIYLKADIIILSLYFDQKIVGLYGAAYRAIDVLTVFPYMFVGVLLPLITSAWVKQDKERFKMLLQQGFDALSIVAVPLSVGTIFLAKPIMILIAGQDFAEAGKILQVLMIALGILYLGNIFTHTIIAIDKQKKMMWGFLFVAITSLIGYFVFIRLYGYWGAAWVTVYSESLVTIIAFIVVTKTSKILPKFNILLKSIIASIIMGIFLYKSPDLNMFIAIIVAISIYFIIMFLIKGIDKNIIKAIINKK